MSGLDHLLERHLVELRQVCRFGRRQCIGQWAGGAGGWRRKIAQGAKEIAHSQLRRVARNGPSATDAATGFD